MQYKFIDLFAGIGGFRKGFEDAGLKCVFTSEMNPQCQQVYESNFGEKPSGDITKIDPIDLPILIFCWAVFRANLLAYQAKKWVLRTQEELCFLTFAKLLTKNNQV